MPTIKVEFSELREFYEYDYLGDKDTRNICIQYPTHLIVDKKRVSILVKAKVSKGDSSKTDEAIKSLFNISKNVFLIKLNKIDKLDIFSAYEVTVYKDDSISEDAKLLLSHEPIEVNITDNLANSFNESVKEYIAINDIVAKVVYQLRDYAFKASAWEHCEYRHEMLTYYNFLIYCFERSFNQFHTKTDLYNDIYVPIIELAKRKIEDNYNYQHWKEKMKKTTFRLSSPNTWTEKPIIPDEIKNKFDKEFNNELHPHSL